MPVGNQTCTCPGVKNATQGRSIMSNRDMVGGCSTTSSTVAACPPLTSPSLLLAGTPLLEECSKLLLGEGLIQEAEESSLAGAG